MKAPNIIFILADDLGHGDVGCYGQTLIETPNIDKLAQSGLRFVNAYGGPVCGPARACLMTGQHQGTGYIKGNPVGGRDVPLRKCDQIIPEMLKERNYDTACIGKWGLGPYGTTGYPTAKGFDYFFGYDTHIACHNYYPEFLYENDEKYPLEKGTYSHHLLTEKALDWVNAKHDNPYFLYLAYTLPHGPFNPPSEGIYKDKEWSDVCKKYASMVTLMDHDIGKILESIDDNTLVIFSSDNGPCNGDLNDLGKVEFFNSTLNRRGIKRDVYEGGIRIPFIAWFPKLIKSGVVEHVTAFQDIKITLAELTKTQCLNSDGISFLPTLLGQEGQEEHEMLYWEFIHMGKGGCRQSCLDLKNNLKGVRYGAKGELQLFNLDSDRKESNDICDQDPSAVARLAKYMDDIRGDSEYWPIPDHGWNIPEDYQQKHIKKEEAL